MSNYASNTNNNTSSDSKSDTYASSVISYASSSTIEKGKEDKKKNEVDLKKIQEQAMRSYIKFQM